MTVSVDVGARGGRLATMTRDHCPAGVAHRTRIERHTVVAAGLSEFDDHQLRRLVDDAPTLGWGIGGTDTVVQVGDQSVFFRRVALTDLEREPGNVMSTANLFGLPVACQYGVGSPSFGVWRELAANEMATDWVLAGRSPNFPLMHLAGHLVFFLVLALRPRGLFPKMD